MSSVWRDFQARTSDYIGRCSKCGKYEPALKKQNIKLKVHWFFNGVYCESCIQDILYDNTRSFGAGEIK